MTVHVISVGLSVLKAISSPYRPFGDRADLISSVKQTQPRELLSADGIGKGDREQASDWLAAALAPAGAPGHDAGKADRLMAAARGARPDLWPAKVSAELSTFDRSDEMNRPLPSADIAVLICSDTPDGLLAGVWNAAALTGNRLDRLTYLALPQAIPADVRGRVIIAKVSGMDAASKQGFEEAMRQLGTLGHDLLQSGIIAAREPFRFYLSGGFKAAIPYLIGLAEGLRSLNPDRSVSAFVLHDTAPEGAERIELPLRYLIADQVRTELSHFEDGVRKTIPKPPMLRGYAYDIVGGKCRMNAFGAGLHALFGIDITGLGR